MIRAVKLLRLWPTHRTIIVINRMHRKTSKMKYQGYLLKESLDDKTILKKLTIINTETYSCPEHMRAEYMDDFWTGIIFTGDVEEADEIANTLSKAVKKQGWFIEIGTDALNYLIFPNKVVKYPRINNTNKPWPTEAVEIAKTIKVPAFVEKEIKK